MRLGRSLTPAHQSQPLGREGLPGGVQAPGREHRQGRTREPSRGPASDSQHTYRCSVGSAAPCWSLLFGILWSITIVSVFAKQNPLDLMISENKRNEGGNSQGFEVLTFGAHTSLFPLLRLTLPGLRAQPFPQ